MVVSGQHDTMFNLSTVKNPGAHSVGGWVGFRAGLGPLEDTRISRPKFIKLHFQRVLKISDQETLMVTHTDVS